MELTADHWQLGCEKIKERITYLLQWDKWSDCKFLVGPETCQEVIQGHKAILASASPVFEAMFFGNFSEGKSPIPIPDIQPSTFRAFLAYVYADYLKISSLEEAINLYYAAKKYMLPHLTAECSKYLHTNLIWKNACRIYEFALMFDEKELSNESLHIVESNTKAVLAESSFEDLQLSTVVTIFSLDRIACTELDLFEAAERYYKSLEKRMEICSDTKSGASQLEPSVPKDIVVVKMQTSGENTPESTVESTKKDKTAPAPLPTKYKETPNIRTAIERIRFLTLTPEQFAEGLAKSSLLTETEAFAIFMNISSSSESGVPMPSGFSICRLNRTLEIDY